MWNPAEFRYDSGVGDHNTGGCGAQRNREVWLKHLFNAQLFHDIQSHLALLGRGRFHAIEAFLHFSQTDLEAVSKRLVFQGSADDLADCLMQVGCSLQRVEQRGVVNLGIRFDQATAKFGEA